VITHYPFSNLGANTKFNGEKVFTYKFKTDDNKVYLVEFTKLNNDFFEVAFFLRKFKNRNYSVKYGELLGNVTNPRKVIYTTIAVAYNFITSSNSDASFLFMGFPISNQKNQEKSILETKRYKLWTRIANNFFNPDTWISVAAPDSSCYMLINPEQKSFELSMNIFDKYIQEIISR